MKLFNDKIVFNTLVAEASKSLNIPIQIVEKDYFVTELLKALVKRMPNILLTL